MIPIEALSIIEGHLAKNRKAFDVTQYLFDKQLEFVLDPSRFKTACCGGRAGKTIADAAYLIKEALQYEGCVAIYITLSRLNAKKLIWPELRKINQQYKLGGKVNESDLSIRYGNSYVYASGASTRADIEKFRGLPIRICIIDEVQSFPTYIKELIDDVITKRLFDYNGILALTGTPGPVPCGYFYDACHSPAYAHFHWTMFDNPWIHIKSGKTQQALLDEELARKGVDISHPSIQREVYGKWILDTSNLVLNYNSEKNHYEELPAGQTFKHIMGIDIGFKDADAIAILGHSDSSPTTYLIDECVTTKQGLTELFTQVELLRKQYEPYKIVIDTGGLGLKIAEEMRRRWRIPVYAAEKVRKFENLELLNDSLRTYRFRAKNKSRFATDSMLLEWDTDRLKPDRRYISDRFHSDIIDAVLYAFRESPAYTYTPEAIKPKWGTKEWGKEEEKKMEEEAIERALEKEVNTEYEWL
jgi:hypothetical protein